MWLFAQPNDTLFFRDGRSFEAGADVWTWNVFPPYPSTIYGMLRTFFINMVSTKIDSADYFAHIPKEYTDLLGTKNELGSLSILGPFLGKKDKNEASLWIPSPSDLWKWEDRNNGKTKYYLLRPDSNRESVSQYTDLNIPFNSLVFHTDQNVSELERSEGTIGGDRLGNYLIGDLKKIEKIRTEKFWEPEYSTIITRDDNRLSAQEGLLAFPLHTRLQDCITFVEKGFLFQVKGLNEFQIADIDSKLNKPEAARLGGEGRIAIIEKINIKLFDQERIKQQITSNGKFRVILTSPAYFPQNTFYPDFLSSSDGKTLEGQWVIDGNGKTVRLVSMAMGDRAVRIGGWDLVKKGPKDMIKAVPAGSVYFFEISNFVKDKDNGWLVKLVESSLPGILPDGEDDYKKQGFNTYLIGG